VWLNTRKQQWPGAGYQLRGHGNGSNTIWIDPDHDIVFVWHGIRARRWTA
jgi:hypothetical protein